MSFDEFSPFALVPQVSRAGLGLLCLSDSMARSIGVDAGVVIATDRSNKLQGVEFNPSTGRIIPGCDVFLTQSSSSPLALT